MFVNRQRDKLIQAILYFSQRTKHCHTLKLFKLLNFLDFEHYRQTGRTVTGLEYRALRNGPVPMALYTELDNPRADFTSAIGVLSNTDPITDELKSRSFKALRAFDPSIFTRRELEIMDRVAEFFAETRSQDMSDYSHLKGSPWHVVFDRGAGRNKRIPPELSLKGPPIVHDAPTIEDDELAYRLRLLEGAE